MSAPDREPSRAVPADSDPLAEEIPEDRRIVEIAEEYLAQLELGLVPDRAAYANRYPELARAVEQCLEGLDMLHGGPSPSSATRLRSGPPPQPGGDAPPTALGDFQIVREVARGGMGIVYEAVQLSLGRRVALKVLPFAATLDARQLQRFKNEAQAAALLHHTNIVPVFAVGCERGVHFYAMQLIEGESLATLIEQLRRRSGLGRTERFPTSSRIHSSHLLGGEQTRDFGAEGGPAPSETGHAFPDTVSPFHANLSTQHAGREGRFYQTAARLMLQAAQALEHAHEFGIVHRDIKPGNLLLDAHGALWVTDFGLAQFHADAGLTRTGDIPGTIRYMSPEQASGQAALLDARTDIYSLGATFYEFLTLAPIFDGRNVQSLLHQILHAEPRGLRERDKSIPAELETIVLKCVSKNAADRYLSAGELAADIQRYLEHKPILARRPTLVDRARKWSRRHPSIVVAGMLLLAVVSVGLFISNRMISAEQSQTAAARDREKARANEAEESFRQARQAVDVLIQVSEEELAENNNPMVQRTRQRLLEIALGYYQEFIEQRRGDAALAAVEERVKGILHELSLLEREREMWFLEVAAVHDALELSAAQRSRLEELLRKWEKEREEVRNDGRQLDEDARRRQFVGRAEEHERMLAEVLSAAQRRRLGQLMLQQQGLFAFKDPRIIQELKLTSVQRRAIREIEHEVFGPRFPQPPGRGRGGQGRGPMWEPQVVNRAESVKRVVALLTDEQNRKWSELTGVPFAGLDEPEFRGPRGFGPAGFGPPFGERGRRRGSGPDDFRPEQPRRTDGPRPQ